MQQGIISFTTSVFNDDWDKNMGGWRCPSLKIPGAKVDTIFVNGAKVDDGKYQILENHSVIRWIGENPPSQALVSITLTKELTTKELSTRWKKLAIILPFFAALVTALISYYSNFQKSIKLIEDKPKETKSTAQMINNLDTFSVMFPRGLRAVVLSTNLSQDSLIKENPSKYLLKKGIALGKVDDGLKKAYAGLVQKSPEEIRFIPWIIDGKPAKIGYSYAIQNAGPVSTARYKEVQLFQGDNYFTIYVHKTADGEPQGKVIEPLKSGINWEYVKAGLSEALEELYLRKSYVQFGGLGVFQEPGGSWEYRLDYKIIER